MALSKNWKLENGLEIPNAYIKVATVATTKKSATVRIEVFVNREYAEKGESVYEVCYIFSPDFSTGSTNMWEQAYEYIKTLPEYEGAENV